MMMRFRWAVVTLLAGCLALGFVVAQAQSVTIYRAEWESGNRQLDVRGNGVRGHTVTVKNAGSGAVIRTATVNSEGRWRIEVDNPSLVPCRVRAEMSGDGAAERDVSNRPSNCGPMAGTTNQPPTCTIDSPTSNVSMTAGQSVNFQGSATDPNGNPITYSWNFGDGRTSTAQDPGNTTYNTAGTFNVTFRTTDSLGASCSTVATRTITVTSTATQNQPPNGTISSPSSNQTITAGQSVNFQGSGSDPDNNTPLTYTWNFGGGVSNSTTQNPGNITFSSAGTYTVMLTVTDSLRLADPSPATRMVTVQSVAGGTPHSGITVADTDNNGYISVKEVTAKCLECHTDKAQQMFHSIHYQWTGRASNVSNISGNAGKNQGALNSYCGSIDTSPWYTCLNCHAGGGGHPMAPQDFAMLSPAAQPQELSNIDCLVCHQDSYVRAGRNAATAQTDPPYIDSQAVGQNGQPVTIQIPDENKPFEFVPFYDWRNNTQDVTALQNAVRNPHPTTRKGCLRCHAGAAGSNGGKRGDLANMTVSPTPTQDVHMSIERQLLWPAH